MFINVLVIFCNVVVHILQLPSISDAPGADLGRGDVGMGNIDILVCDYCKAKIS